jgi:general secretion pathway protein D
MSADDKRNLLLIMTTPAQYKSMLTYLERLDVPPKQVLIEAMVAELTLSDDLKYGFEWLIKNKMLNGSYTLGATFGVPTSPGLTYTFLSESEKINVTINLLASKDLVNILSTPRLMVLDNEEATIQVGTDIPVVTGQVTTAEAAGATTGVVQTIQYRSTGIILRVKPTINTEGLLTLNITQEVSEMGSNPPGVSSPSILVRKINTSVVASSGQSIVLGGLMSETQSSSESKVPFIGDIPLLGEFFKSKSREKRKTELIVILTPKIVSTLEEATNITEDFKKELKWFK